MSEPLAAFSPIVQAWFRLSSQQCKMSTSSKLPRSSCRPAVDLVMASCLLKEWDKSHRDPVLNSYAYGGARDYVGRGIDDVEHTAEVV